MRFASPYPYSMNAITFRRIFELMLASNSMELCSPLKEMIAEFEDSPPSLM